MSDKMNKAIEIAESLTRDLVPASSPDHDILQIIAEYSLQLGQRQQLVLNRIFMLSRDARAPEQFRSDVLAFIQHYKETKRYHDTMPYIGRGVEALSLRRFWSQNGMHGAVNKNIQQ